MREAPAEQNARARAWLQRSVAAGWLTAADASRFDAVERRTPADLFKNESARPLVVAFFGGTGVGKSSLLNRLAGEPIARTGVERPTSHEVTLYVHNDVELADLPDEFPLDKVRTERHFNDRGRDVLWIDMPDIDSTERDNRTLALAWLPQIDLLVYVVSPERYRDDVGWKVLHQRRQRHGWMFVMNRWDEGDVEQAGDFAHLLREAGFDDPLLLRTACRRPSSALPSPDEFERIAEAIEELLHVHGLQELDRLGHRARLMDLRSAVQESLRRLPDDDGWIEIEERWREAWQRTRDVIPEGLAFALCAAAARFAVRQGNVVAKIASAAGRMVRADGGASGEAARGASAGDDEAERTEIDVIASQVWDDWAQDKLAECPDAVEVLIARRGASAAPIRSGLDQASRGAEGIVRRELRGALRQALARPGTVLQRAARQGTGFLMAVLPTAALLWVASQVVAGFYRGSTAQAEYLGTSFAVNSGLLVLVSWAVPFALHRLLRPSLERTARRGLRRGLEAGLDALGLDYVRALESAREQCRLLRAEGEGLAEGIFKLAHERIDTGKAPVARLLALADQGNGAD